MRIVKETGEEFQISPDMILTFEKTNPFFSNQGAQSLPVTLPASAHNLALVGYPTRAGRRLKFVKKHKVYVQEGIYFKSATFEIFSGSFSKGITGTIHISEGEFYNRMKEVTLQEAFSSYVRNDFSGTQEEKVVKWLNYLTRVMTGEIEDDFRVFPVATEVKWSHNDFDNIFHMLNDVNVGKEATAHDGLPYYPLAAYDEQLIVNEDDLKVTEPVGYGVTPFLKCSYVLTCIFKYLGYELLDSMFTTHADYKKMVILNNTADAILKGRIDYSQLLPEKTIDEFLSAFRKKYLLDFFVSEDGKKVEIRFMTSILDEEPDEDYSGYVDGELETEYEEPKQIKLSSERNLEKASVNFDTYQEFIRNNTPQESKTTYEEMMPYKTEGISMIRNVGIYVKIEYLHERTVDGVHIGAGTFRSYYDRDLFNYYDKYDSLKVEEFKSPDEFVPMILTYFTIGSKGGVVSTGMRMPIPFVGPRRHLNSYVRIDGEDQTEKKTNCPLMFCFSIGRGEKYLEYSYPNSYRIFLGTTREYNNAGSKWGETSLSYSGENGLFLTNWKKYDEILRNSTPVLTGKINLPPEKIASLRMDKLKIIGGQPVLPLSIKYIQKNGYTEVQEMKFKCIKDYE